MAEHVHPEREQRDNKRASRWLIIAVALLLALALGYNLLSHQRVGPLTQDAPTGQATPAPAPAGGGGLNGAAGPGTGGGTGTGAGSGAGAPAGTPRP